MQEEARACDRVVGVDCDVSAVGGGGLVGDEQGTCTSAVSTSPPPSPPSKAPTTASTLSVRAWPALESPPPSPPPTAPTAASTLGAPTRPELESPRTELRNMRGGARSETGGLPLPHPPPRDTSSRGFSSRGFVIEPHSWLRVILSNSPSSSLLTTDYWLLTTDCSLLTIYAHYLVLTTTAHCLPLTTHDLLIAIHYSLLTICYLLPTAHHSLLTTHYR